ncbi:MAG TPA: HAD family phosphatase [Bacteroidota bacterium]|nr:HAD family phosphatase [Bacteroidota bacterium]
MSDKFEAVLFDLGNVLVRIDFDAFPRALGLDPAQTRPDSRTVVGKLSARYETGTISTDEFFGQLSELLGGRFGRDELESAWNAIIGEENEEMVPIVDEVRQEHTIALISNTSPIHLIRSEETMPVLRRFSKRYLSYEVGAAKPSVAMYRHVVEDLGVDPSAVVLIDDVRENVDGAIRCGLVGILFRDVIGLREELHELRILD